MVGCLKAPKAGTRNMAKPKPKPTPIEEAYSDLKESGVPEPEDLAERFGASVRQLEKQIRGSGSFDPGKRTPLPRPGEIRRRDDLSGTDDLAAMLWEPKRFKV